MDDGTWSKADIRIVAGTTGMPVEPLLPKMRDQIIGDLISG